MDFGLGSRQRLFLSQKADKIAKEEGDEILMF